MKNRIAKERLIFSNYDWPDREDVIENIKANGYEDKDITEEMISNWSYDELEMWWEEVKSELEEFFDGKRILLTGNIGRWNGISSGFNTYDDFEKMLSFATEDCGYWKFYDENGHLFLHCSHHDGSCTYEIKELTEKGKEYLENWEYNWDDKRSNSDIHKQLVTRYSRLPNFSHKIYGCKKREYEPQSKERFISMLNNQAKSYYA